MSERVKRLTVAEADFKWPDDELVVRATDYDALHAEAEALRAENGRIQRELAIAQSDIKVEKRVSSNLRQHKNDYMDAAEGTQRALKQEISTLSQLLHLARGAIGENKWTMLAKDIDTALCAADQQPAQEVQGLVEALEHARLFIRNGVELGYVKMPDADTPDPAHETLPKIEASLAAHRQAQQGEQP